MRVRVVVAVAASAGGHADRRRRRRRSCGQPRGAGQFCRRSPTPRRARRRLFTELGKVLTHPRCVNCHPAGDRPRQGDVGAAASAAGRARRGRIRPRRPCAARSATRAPISSPAACRAIRTGTSRRARWRGRARRSARSAPRSRIPRATAAARWRTLVEHIGDRHAGRLGLGAGRQPHAGAGNAKGGRRARRSVGANRRGVPALDRG